MSESVGPATAAPARGAGRDDLARPAPPREIQSLSSFGVVLGVLREAVPAADDRLEPELLLSGMYVHEEVEASKSSYSLHRVTGPWRAAFPENSHQGDTR